MSIDGDIEQRVRILEGAKQQLDGSLATWKFISGICGASAIGCVIWLLSTSAFQARVETKLDASERALKELEVRLEKANDKAVAQLEKRIEKIESKVYSPVGIVVHKGKVVSLKDSRIVIHEEGRDASFTFAQDASIIINSKVAQIQDIRPGADATFFTDPTKGHIVRIEVIQPK